MKQKVEAFEKLQSPVPQRETRTRTRQNTNDGDVRHHTQKMLLLFVRLKINLLFFV